MLACTAVLCVCTLHALVSVSAAHLLGHGLLYPVASSPAWALCIHAFVCPCTHPQLGIGSCKGPLAAQPSRLLLVQLGVHGHLACCLCQFGGDAQPSKLYSTMLWYIVLCKDLNNCPGRRHAADTPSRLPTVDGAHQFLLLVYVILQPPCCDCHYTGHGLGSTCCYRYMCALGSSFFGICAHRTELSALCATWHALCAQAGVHVLPLLVCAVAPKLGFAAHAVLLLCLGGGLQGLKGLSLTSTACCACCVFTAGSLEYCAVSCVFWCCCWWCAVHQQPWQNLLALATLLISLACCFSMLQWLHVLMQHLVL